MHVGMTACLYVHHMQAVALRGQKRVLGLSELELKVSELPNVGSGKQTQVLCKRSKYSPASLQPLQLSALIAKLTHSRVAWEKNCNVGLYGLDCCVYKSVMDSELVERLAHCGWHHFCPGGSWTA